jgi:hypothetical protein
VGSFKFLSFLMFYQTNVKHNYQICFKESFFYFKKINKKIMGFLIFFSHWFLSDFTSIKKNGLNFFTNLLNNFLYFCYLTCNNQTQPLYTTVYNVIYNKIKFSDYSSVLLWPISSKHLVSSFFKRFSICLTVRKCLY